MKTILHVGCGPANIHHLPKFFQDGTWDELRYDIDETVNPDVVGTLQDMSLIEDNSIDAIYSSHNIEHVHSFEVLGVLSEFFRVLKPDGFAIVMCPDIMSVAQAIVQGSLTDPLYASPAGPITSIDILYGHQDAIRSGNHFMAHKTAFNAQTLATALISSNFLGGIVLRDRIFGLHSLSTKEEWRAGTINDIAVATLPPNEDLLESFKFGCYQ